MPLRVVGAGLGRTGTHSLKLALERLLGRPCHHMIEVFERPEDIPVWHAAVTGPPPDWEQLLAGYAAIVDWPGVAFWRELIAANPEALVLLSVRDDAGQWWRSADRTILEAARRRNLGGGDPTATAQLAMWRDILRHRFSEQWDDPEQAMAAYERHNQAVREAVPAGRLIEWRPGDGWQPLCAGLGVPVPDEAFPKVNTTADFRAMAGFDAPAGGTSG